MMKLPIRILSHDPGSANYGVSAIEVDVVRGKMKFRILYNYKYRNTIHDVKKAITLKTQMSFFMEEFETQLKEIGPDFVVAERFQARGRTGATSEYVNIMLGGISHRLLPTKKRFSVVTASTWKNEVRRWGIDLDLLYKQVRVTPHQLDSTLLGIFIADKVLRISKSVKDQRPVITQAWIKQLVKQVEFSSLEPLKRVRK